MSACNAETKSQPATLAEPRRRGSVAGFMTLGFIALGVGVCVWMAQQPPQPKPGIPYGVIFAGAVTCLGAVVAYFRQMSFRDVAEFAFDILADLTDVVGLFLGAIWSFFLGLFGLD